MLKTVDYQTEVTLTELHSVRFRSIGGLFNDKFDIFIDGQVVFSTIISWLDTKHQKFPQSYEISLEGKPAQILWRWSPFTGNPRYIALSVDNCLLAKYGNTRSLTKRGYI